MHHGCTMISWMHDRCRLDHMFCCREVTASLALPPTDCLVRRCPQGVGGWVDDGRVCGVLAVSRAFGDAEFKGPGLPSLLLTGIERGYWNDEFAAKQRFSGDPVVAIPDVQVSVLTWLGLLFTSSSSHSSDRLCSRRFAQRSRLSADVQPCGRQACRSRTSACYCRTVAGGGTG